MSVIGAKFEISTGIWNPWCCKILYQDLLILVKQSVKIFQNSSHTNMNFIGNSVVSSLLIFWKLLEHSHNRINWNNEKLKTYNYLKVFVTSRNPLQGLITCLMARKLIWHVLRSVTATSSFSCCAILIFWRTWPSASSFKPYAGLLCLNSL